MTDTEHNYITIWFKRRSSRETNFCQALSI